MQRHIAFRASKLHKVMWQVVQQKSRYQYDAIRVTAQCDATLDVGLVAPILISGTWTRKHVLSRATV